MGSATTPSHVHPTTAPLNSPAPCLRRSVAELVADAESFFSSMGSRRHGMVTGAPCLETYPLPTGCGDRCNTFCSWPLPRSGMTSLQGRAKGVMECWYTSAERQPGERRKTVSIGPVLPDEELFAPAGLIQ